MAAPSGISSTKGRCNAQCFMAQSDDSDFGKVGTCCIKESDCLNGNCEYGRCVSNCNSADYLKKNRFVGDCCDYDSHCAQGLSCYASMQTCQVSGSNAFTDDDGGNQEFTGETENETPLDSGDDNTVIQPPANEPASIDNGSTGDQNQPRQNNDNQSAAINNASAKLVVDFEEPDDPVPGLFHRLIIGVVIVGVLFALYIIFCIVGKRKGWFERPSNS